MTSRQRKDVIINQTFLKVDYQGMAASPQAIIITLNFETFWYFKSPYSFWRLVQFQDYVETARLLIGHDPSLFVEDQVQFYLSRRGGGTCVSSKMEDATLFLSSEESVLPQHLQQPDFARDGPPICHQGGSHSS